MLNLTSVNETFQRLDDLPEDFSGNSSWKIQKNTVTKNLDFITHFFEINEP